MLNFKGALICVCRWYNLAIENLDECKSTCVCSECKQGWKLCLILTLNIAEQIPMLIPMIVFETSNGH